MLSQAYQTEDVNAGAMFFDEHLDQSNVAILRKLKYELLMIKWYEYCIFKQGILERVESVVFRGPEQRDAAA